MAKEKSTRGASRPRKEKPLSPMDLLKLEVAEELGLLEKVRNGGWGMLTAAETGRIGGIMTRRLRQKAQGMGSETAKP